MRQRPPTLKPEASKPTEMSARRRWRRRAGKLLLLVLSTCVSLLLAEGLVRWLAPQQLILLRPDVWQADDSGLGWVQTPNIDTRINTGEREIHLRTDEHGYRITSETPTATPGHRILALGDSYLAAIQVEAEDTMTELLARTLSERFNDGVEVVNTGVGGWGPSHYRIKAAQELDAPADGRPYDLVLVFLYLGNDIEAWRRDAFPPKQSTVRHAWRWPRSLRPGELVNAWLYPLNDTLETRSHLFMLARNQAWYLLMRMGLSARHLDSAYLRREAEAERWALTARQCQEIDEVTAAHGIDALFVLLPGAVEVDARLGEAYARALGESPAAVDYGQPARLMEARLRELGLDFVNLSDPMRQHFEATGERLHGLVDTHFSPAGHIFAAATLEPRLTTLLTRSPLQTQSTSDDEADGGPGTH